MISRTKSGLLRLALASAAVVAVTLPVVPAWAAAPAAGTPRMHAASTDPVVAGSRSAVVVKARTRAHVGRILVTTTGRALYYLPHGSCTGECLTIWPRLNMPAGKTTPKGARCLGTKSLGMAGRLQVTYRKHPLYTFADDSGISVTGNGVDGFKVAKVVSRCP